MVMDSETPRRWPRSVVQIALGFGIAVLALAGIIAVGNVARDSLGPQHRYEMPFAEIECPAPPGMDHSKFLGEVQYNGQFDDTLNLLDADLPGRLRAAFEQHRRVERVLNVRVLPPKRVVVELKFKPA